LLRGPTGVQPSGNHQPPVEAGVETSVFAGDDCVGADRQRDVERAPDFQTEEAGRCDADDFERFVGEGYFATDDVWIAAEFTLPEPMADDCARRRAATVIVRRGQQTSAFRL